MTTTRQISDDEFNEARTRLLPLIQGFTRKYANILSPERLEAAGDMALWRCLKTFDPVHKQKLSSSLFRYVQWECLNAIREERQQHTQTVSCDMSCEEENVSINMILDDYLSLLPKRERRVVEARFLHNHTLQEIAETEGYTKQGIQEMVNRSLGVMSEAALAG